MYYQYAPIKVRAFSPNSPLGNKNSERASASVPQPLHPHILGLAFFVNFTAPNKQLPDVKSVFIYLDHVFNP